jgi:hypothetical protein
MHHGHGSNSHAVKPPEIKKREKRKKEITSKAVQRIYSIMNSNQLGAWSSVVKARSRPVILGTSISGDKCIISETL